MLELSFIGDYNKLKPGVRRASSSAQKVAVKNCSSKRSIPGDCSYLFLLSGLKTFRLDRELRIVSLQDIVVAVGIDEFEDRLALGIDHPLRLFRHEDLGYWGVTDVFRPDVVSARIGFIFKGIQP